MRPPTEVRHVFRLPASRVAAFELFADPAWLDALTPPWFRLRPRGELPPGLAAGSEISYRLRWRGVPFAWTSVLTDWRPPEFFAYEQKRGPYRTFRHEHFFRAVAGGTEVEDRVLFRAPGGVLADRLIAGPDLRRIFARRERRALPCLLARRQAGGRPLAPARDLEAGRKTLEAQRMGG